MLLTRLLVVITLSCLVTSKPADACGGGSTLPLTPVLFAMRPFSAAAMAEAVTASAACRTTRGRCEPVEVIQSWGAAAVPALLEIAKTHSTDYKLLAPLEKAHVANTGMKLIAIAKTLAGNDISPSNLYVLAIRIDGARAFAVLASELDRTTDKTARRELHAGMLEAPALTFAYIERRLPRSPNPLELADLAVMAAGATSHSTLARMIDLTSDQRAKQWLASNALRDPQLVHNTKLWTVLHDGLTSGDAATRDAAKNLFAPALVPDVLRTKFLSTLVDDVAAGRRTMSLGLARDMIDLGSQDSTVYDFLFQDLASKKLNLAFRSAFALRVLAPKLPATVKAHYISVVQDVHDTTTNTNLKKLLTTTLQALRA